MTISSSSGNALIEDKLDDVNTTLEGELSNKSRTTYTSSVITALSSSTVLADWIAAYSDGVLGKSYHVTFDTNNDEPIDSYFTFMSLTSGKCLRRLRSYNPADPYNIIKEVFFVSDWTYEAIVSPALVITNGAITSPANHTVSLHTTVCTLSVSGGWSAPYQVVSGNAYYFIKKNAEDPAATVTGVSVSDTLLLVTSPAYPADRSGSGYTDSSLITLTDSFGLGADGTVTVVTTQVPGDPPSDFSNVKASIKATDANYVYENWDQPKSTLENGTGNMHKDSILCQYTRLEVNFSISFYFKLNEALPTDRDVGLLAGSRQYGASTPYGFSLHKDDVSGEVTVGLKKMFHTLPGGVDLEDGDWHHFCFTSDPLTGTSDKPMVTTWSALTGGQDGGTYYGNDPSNTYINFYVYIDGTPCLWESNQYNRKYIEKANRYNSSIGGPSNDTFFGQRVTSSNSYTSVETDANYGIGFGGAPLLTTSDAKGGPIDMSFDEFSFHNVTLTSNQVTDLYNNMQPVNLEDTTWDDTDGTWATENLIIWWRFGDGDNDGETEIESVAGAVPLYLYTDSDPSVAPGGWRITATEVTPKIRVKNGTSAEVLTLTGSDEIYIAE